jgi:hypothetical protein
VRVSEPGVDAAHQAWCRARRARCARRLTAGAALLAAAFLAAASFARGQAGSYTADVAGLPGAALRGKAAYCTGDNEVLVILGEPEMGRFVGFFRQSHGLPRAGEMHALLSGYDPQRPRAFYAALPLLRADDTTWDARFQSGALRFTAAAPGRLAGTFRIEAQAEASARDVEAAARGGVTSKRAVTLTGTFDASAAGDCMGYVRW